MKPTPQQTLGRFFTGLTEHAFVARLGVADPPLVDYVAGLLVRFLRNDAVYHLRDLAGRRLEEVAGMMLEGQERIGEARRDLHQHVGDFTLFWTGLYPESLQQMQNTERKDFFLDYCEQGKRAYYIASTIPGNDKESQNVVLRRLSHEFEMCVYGLGEVRREWERRDGNFSGILPINN
jgi:hypothetical protein